MNFKISIWKVGFAALAYTSIICAQAPPVLHLSLAAITASGTRTQSLAPFTTNLTSSSSTQIDYTASSAQKWIQVTGATSGSTPASLVFTLNPVALAPGTYFGRVTISAPAAGGTAYIPVTLTILPFVAAPSGSLYASNVFPTGANPRALVVSDFNGDGYSDIATANQTDNTVTVMLGDGAGHFRAAPGSPVALTASPYALAAGDFNNDGSVDLAVISNVASTVTVLLGNGAGGFAAAPGSPFATGSFPSSVAIGDFSGDRQLDIAVANSGDSTLTVLLGNGTGGFSLLTTGLRSVSTGLVSIAAGDFNGDGIQDLVADSTAGTSSTATVLLGSALGFSLAPGSPFALPSASSAVTAGDWNLDGALDLAFSGLSGTGGAYAVAVYLGGGGGGFTAAPPVAAGNPGVQYSSILSGDIDGDGIPDLVLLSLVPNPGYILLGNGVGGFAPVPGFILPQSTSAQIGDFNGDNRSDIAIPIVQPLGLVSIVYGGLNLSGVSLRSSTQSSPTLVGSPVTLTASVSSLSTFVLRPPTGSVTLMDDSAILATLPLSNGVATFTTSSLGVGTHAITTNYNGDVRSATANSVSYITVRATAGAISIYFGTPKEVSVNSQVAPLQVIVDDGLGYFLSGVPVTFSAPASGASGTFASSPTVLTDANGIATAPAFTANSIPGFFSIVASIASPVESVSFSIYSTATSALRFIPVAPCRVADTRGPAGPFGAPSIAGQTSRNFVIPSSGCGIPATAQAYSFNVTAVPHGPLGYLTVYGTGSAQPVVSTLNSDGRIKANAAIIPAGSGGGVTVFASNTTDVILDVSGYFVPASTSGALGYYPVTCRLVDTRGPAGTSGGPYMPALTTRTFLLYNTCVAPNSPVQAYSLNFTAIPRKGSLGYLTAWPASQQRPNVSLLNALTGAVTANAAILPADLSGAISVFTTDDTDLVIDATGYFAPTPNAGTLALSNFYLLQPCRVLDTRLPLGSPLVSGGLNIPIASTACASPSAAQAYLMNATVVPGQSLGYLTLGSGGSTLNAIDAAVTSNMAIVPSTNGFLSAFVTNPTALIIDIFGYFAP